MGLQKTMQYTEIPIKNEPCVNNQLHPHCYAGTAHGLWHNSIIGLQIKSNQAQNELSNVWYLSDICSKFNSVV